MFGLGEFAFSYNTICRNFKRILLIDIHIHSDSLFSVPSFSVCLILLKEKKRMKEKKEQKKEKVSLVCQGPVQTACSVYANIPSLV